MWKSEEQVYDDYTIHYYYGFSTIEEIKNWQKKDNESIINLWYDVDRSEWIVHIKSWKIQDPQKHNFIFKMRELSKKNINADFSQKYPRLANHIESAAKCGFFKTEMFLSNLDLNLLKQEGFKIKNICAELYEVSWEDDAELST